VNVAQRRFLFASIVSAMACAALVWLCSRPDESVVVQQSNRDQDAQAVEGRDRWSVAAPAESTETARTPTAPAAVEILSTQPSASTNEHVASSLAAGEGFELRGDVIDSTTRAPIAGVAVIDAARSLEWTRTDSNGNFEARIVADESSNLFVLGLRAPGYCWIRREWSMRELSDEGPLHVDLIRVARLAGIVRDRNGSVIANLNLVVHPDSQAIIFDKRCPDTSPSERLRDALRGWSIDEFPSEFAAAITDESGRFETTGLPPWTPCYCISSQSNAFETDVHGGPLGGPGEVSHVDVVAQRLAVTRLKGRLLLNGSPVAGAISWCGATRSGAITANTDGRFVLEGVEPGHVIVDVRCSTEPVPEVTAYSELNLTKRYEITVATDRTSEETFELVVPLATISGHVRLANGGPPGTKTISASARRGTGALRVSVQTNVQGEWSLRVPADLDPCTVRVEQHPDAPQREGVLVGANDVDFVLPSPARLRLRVLDAARGSPIANPEMSYCRSGKMEWLFSNHSEPDVEGWISVQLPEGTVDIFVKAPSQGYACEVRRGVQLKSGDPDVSVEVRLEKGIGVTFKLAPGQAEPPEGRIVLALMQPDEWQSLLVREKAIRAWTTHVQDSIGMAIFDARAAYVSSGEPYHVVRLRKGTYRLVPLDEHIAVEPTEIDIQQDDTLVELRWSSR
jgi:hypothetical protein